MAESSRIRKSSLEAAAVVLAVGALAWRMACPAAAADKTVSFSKDIQPVLKAHCIMCHSLDPKKPKKKAAAGFRLDDPAAAMKGGKFGKAIVAGNANDSMLYQLLIGPVPRQDDPDKDIDAMPKPFKRGAKWKPLPKDQIELIKEWIDQGASFAS